MLELSYKIFDIITRSEQSLLIFGISVIFVFIFGTMLVGKLAMHKSVKSEDLKLLVSDSKELKRHNVLFRKWVMVLSPIFFAKDISGVDLGTKEIKKLRISFEGLLFTSFNSVTFGVPFSYIKKISVKRDNIMQKDVVHFRWENEYNSGKVLFEIKDANELIDILSDIFKGEVERI